MLILMRESETTTAPTHFLGVFLPNSDTILIISALISLLSLLRGQLSFASARKKGYVRLFGKLILTVHNVIGIVGRVSSLVLFFTPTLGLFNTLYHVKPSSLKNVSSRGRLHQNV